MKHYSKDMPIVEKEVYHVPYGTRLPIRGTPGELFLLQYAYRPGLYIWHNEIWSRVCSFDSIVLDQVVNGLIRVNKKNSEYVGLTADDCGTVLCDTVETDITLTLPPASLCAGMRFEIKKIHSHGLVKVRGINDEETIDGSDEPLLLDQPYDGITIYGDGREWFILNKI